MATSDEVLVWTGFSISTAASIVYYLASYYLLLPGFYNQTLAANTSTYFDPRFYTLQSDEVDHLRDAAKDMFQFGYDNYMKYAYPLDELDPIHCTGRGPDLENRDNININDVLGDYMLTLVDSLDTLAVMGNATEFKSAVLRVIDNLSFNNDNEVQVFEANIRILGSLLSAHLLITDKCKTFGDLTPQGYDNELLSLAGDLAARLLPAFSETRTGIPYPRVNLNHGTNTDYCKFCINETCSAGAGTLLLEFGVLSALLNDPVYYLSASRAVRSLYQHRSRDTGLIGNVIDIQSGVWTGTMSGVGAGLDSVYEYLIKSAIMFGDQNQSNMFEELYENIGYFLRKGRDYCDSGAGHHPIYVNVDMGNGNVANNWVDSLSAAWPGIQLLNGDMEEAICGHLLYYSIWRKYGALPERFNYNSLTPDVSFYPLRPELVESTYLLYRATRSPFYLHVGKSIMESLNNNTKVQCGYATIHNVEDKSLEDRMESFFLSETCKYLYLLFDDDNPLHRSSNSYMFSTEGHLFPIKHQFRETVASLLDEDIETYFNTNLTKFCKKPELRGTIPLQQKYILQMEEAFNIKF